MKSIVGPSVPSERQSCEPDRWTESGYACGNEVTIEGCYAQRKFSCVGSADQN